MGSTLFLWHSFADAVRSVLILLGLAIGIFSITFSTFSFGSVSAGDDCGPKSRVKFKFYVRNSVSSKAEVLFKSMNSCSLVCSSGKSTMIIIHGYLTNSESDIWKLKNAVFQHFPHVENIIEVDWSLDSSGRGAFSKNSFGWALENSGTNYIVMFNRTVPKVTFETMRLLHFLESRKCKEINMIGHSLGAHISGNAARLYKMVHNTFSVKHIIGLDPAGPLFYHYCTTCGFSMRPGIDFECETGKDHTFHRLTELYKQSSSYKYFESGLTRDDAEHVLVVHTNIGAFGIEKKLGETDIYINRGDCQPECRNLGICLPIIADMCSHSWPVVNFVQEIIPTIFQNYSYFELKKTPGSVFGWKLGFGFMFTLIMIFLIKRYFHTFVNNQL